MAVATNGFPFIGLYCYNIFGTLEHNFGHAAPEPIFNQGKGFIPWVGIKL